MKNVLLLAIIFAMQHTVIFVAITVAGFIAAKAFPLQFAQSSMFIGGGGSIGSFDDDSKN